MGSSASTPSRRSGSITLSVAVVGDDHPRACTGRRLVRLGLVREVRPPLPGARGALVLDPYAQRPLSREDRPRAVTSGVLAIDCSWNRLADRHARPATGPTSPNPSARRLPMLLAANPQHFGRLGELNTAEALAAALWVLGDADGARALLAGFAGGPAFFELNRERLDRYAQASSAAELARAERSLFGSA